MAKPDPKSAMKRLSLMLATGEAATDEEQGFSRQWPSPQVDALADQLEQDTGCSIDREEFWHDMMSFDQVYRESRTGAQSWSPKSYSAMERVQHRCQEFRSSLEDATEAIAPLEDLQAMLTEIDRMERSIKWQAGVVRKMRSSRRSTSHPKAILFENTINALASIYEKHTGRPAGTSTSRTSDGRGGPFVRFVESVLDILEPDNRRAALGESIAKTLRVLKDRRSLPGEAGRWVIHRGT